MEKLSALMLAALLGVMTGCADEATKMTAGKEDTATVVAQSADSTPSSAKDTAAKDTAKKSKDDPDCD